MCIFFNMAKFCVTHFWDSVITHKFIVLLTYKLSFISSAVLVLHILREDLLMLVFLYFIATLLLLRS